MSVPLRVLLIEDSEEDARLLLRELRRGGYEVSYRRVDTPAAMEAALDEESWDVILSEHSMPFFGAPAARELLQSRGLDLPFIVVSRGIGEERAVAVMRAGAHDYISKDNLARLNPTVARELREAETRRERRQAEEALHASENRFRALIENSSDTIVLLAPDTTILYATGSVCRVLGYTLEEVVGRRGLEFIHPEDRELADSRLAELVREPYKTLVTEVRIWHSDGSWRWVEIVGTDLLADPSVEAIVVNARDVTARKETEEKLRRSEKRFRQVVEQAADAFFVHDLTGRFVDVNRQACESLGYTREELLNMSVPDVEMEFTPGALEKVWKKLASGAPLTLRGTHRRKDGTTFPVELRLGVFESEGRRLMLALARDITQRQRAEEALRISEARFRTMIEQSPLSIQVLSPDGRTLQVNRAWEELWGVTLEDIKGYNLLEDRRLVDKGIMPYIQRGFAGEPSLVPPILYDLDESVPELTNHEEHERWVRAFIYPVKDEAGDVREVVLIHEDITERKRAEEALRESEERIRMVIANAPVSLLALNREGVFTLAEGRALEALGFQPEQIVGMSIFEVYRDEPEILAHALHALGGQELSSIHVVTALGLMFEVRWSPVRDQSGGVASVIGVATDITERKRAEEALRESEQRFRSLVRNTSDIITVLDPDGAVLYQSPATE